MSQLTEDQQRKIRREWETLPAAMKKKLAAVGIEGPDFSYHVNGSTVSAHASEGEREFHLANHPAPASVRREAVEDELQELAPGLDAAGAEAIAEWHRREIEAATIREAARILHRVIALLIKPGINLLVAAWGLAFATGLDCVTGVKSQSDCATRVLKLKDRQLLNYYVTMWRNHLGFATLKFCRGEEARQAYRTRALEVHARRKG